MNASTILGYFINNTSFPIANPTAGGVGSTETLFVTRGTTACLLTVPQPGVTLGSFTPLDPTANPAQLASNYGRNLGDKGPAIAGTSPYYNSGSFDNGNPFTIRAFGTGVGGATATTFGVNLYQGTSSTIGSDMNIATPTPVSVTSAKFQWTITATLSWDSNSQILNGQFSTVINNTVGSGAHITQVTSIATPAGLSFGISYVFSAGTANTVSMQEFSMEKV